MRRFITHVFTHGQYIRYLFGPKTAIGPLSRSAEGKTSRTTASNQQEQTNPPNLMFQHFLFLNGKIESWVGKGFPQVQDALPVFAWFSLFAARVAQERMPTSSSAVSQNISSMHSRSSKHGIRRACCPDVVIVVLLTSKKNWRVFDPIKNFC